MNKYFKNSDRRGLPGGPNEQSSYSEGFVISENGQWDYPGMDTLVPTSTGNITMQGVPYPVYGQDETGYGQMMYPGADYVFPGNFVYETPMAQFGTETSTEDSPTVLPYVEIRAKRYPLAGVKPFKWGPGFRSPLAKNTQTQDQLRTQTYKKSDQETAKILDAQARVNEQKREELRRKVSGVLRETTQEDKDWAAEEANRKAFTFAGGANNSFVGGMLDVFNPFAYYYAGKDAVRGLGQTAEGVYNLDPGQVGMGLLQTGLNAAAFLPITKAGKFASGVGNEARLINTLKPLSVQRNLGDISKQAYKSLTRKAYQEAIKNPFNFSQTVGAKVIDAAMRPTLQTIPSGRLMSGFNPEMATQLFNNAFVQLRDDVINSPLFDKFIESDSGKQMIRQYMADLGRRPQNEILELMNRPQFQRLMNDDRIQSIARRNVYSDPYIRDLFSTGMQSQDQQTLLRNADIAERSFIGPGGQTITGVLPAALDYNDVKKFDTIDRILSWGRSDPESKLRMVADSFIQGRLTDDEIKIILNNPNATGKQILDALSYHHPHIGAIDRTGRVSHHMAGLPSENTIFTTIGQIYPERYKTPGIMAHESESLQKFLRKNDPIPEYDPMNQARKYPNLRSTHPEKLLGSLFADENTTPYANGKIMIERIRNAMEEYKAAPSGFVATGSQNTSYNSYLPQLDVLFKHLKFDPNKPISLLENTGSLSRVNDPALRSEIHFGGYHPMNDFGYLSRVRMDPGQQARAAFSPRELSRYINAKMDEKIKAGDIPSTISRPYVSTRNRVMLPHYIISKYQSGGMSNDNTDDLFNGLLPQTGIDFTTIPDDVLAIMIANNR